MNSQRISVRNEKAQVMEEIKGESGAMAVSRKYKLLMRRGGVCGGKYCFY